MLTALTILTIISGVASLLGFAFIFFGKVTLGYKRICALCLGFAAIWSGYVLLVPGSDTETNVASKAYYRLPSIERQSETLLIQRGAFVVSGFSPLAIEFPLPFRAAPEVEVINFWGYDPGEVPRIETITAHQVNLGRQHMLTMGFPATPTQPREFRWVARGVPLEEGSSKK